MKKILLSFSFSMLLLGISKAQILTVSPTTQEAFFNGIVMNEFTDLETHVSVKNNTNDTIAIKWVREVPADCPIGWTTLICDNNNCYAENTSTNVNPPALDIPMVLAPGETYPNFLLHVRPAQQAGCCKVYVHLSTVDNPDEVLETITYDVRVNDPDCLLSSTYEPSVLEAIKAFPNPSTGYFSIADNPLVKKVVVFDVFGRLVQSALHTNGKTYDISDAPDGLYLVSLQDDNGEVIKTVRMTKQASRP